MYKKLLFIIVTLSASGAFSHDPSHQIVQQQKIAHNDYNYALDCESYDYLDSLVDERGHDMQHSTMPPWVKRFLLTLAIRFVNMKRQCERSWNLFKRSLSEWNFFGVSE